MLLLLPGLLCDRGAWAPVIDLLSGVDCRVPDFSLATRLAAMAERVLAAAPDRFALAGHSMGARVALEIVRIAPERVQALALFDTGCRALPAGEAGEAERSRRLALLELARRDGMRAMGRVWLAPMLHPDRRGDGAFVGPLLDMIERQTPDRFAAQIEALLHRRDDRDLLPALRCPTLLACGREDEWSPLAQHQEMAAMIPGSRLVVVERCGHMAPMERPDKVAAALLEWLALRAGDRPGAQPRNRA